MVTGHHHTETQKNTEKIPLLWRVKLSLTLMVLKLLTKISERHRCEKVKTLETPSKPQQATESKGAHENLVLDYTCIDLELEQYERNFIDVLLKSVDRAIMQMVADYEKMKAVLPMDRKNMLAKLGELYVSAHAISFGIGAGMRAMSKAISREEVESATKTLQDAIDASEKRAKKVARKLRRKERQEVARVIAQIPNGPKIMFCLFSYGGVVPETVDTVVREVFVATQNKVNFIYYRIGGDALIPRSRSRAMGIFGLSNQFKDLDVLFMMDHDLLCQPGAIIQCCNKSHEMQSIVGGLYSKRAMGKGWASRFRRDSGGKYEIGSEVVVEPDYLATGFMAIPRCAVNTLHEKLDTAGKLWQEDFHRHIVAYREGGDTKDIEYLVNLSLGRCKDLDGNNNWEYYDYFRCFRVPHVCRGCEGFEEFLSEDWAFIHRVRYCGLKYYVYMYPALTHYGEHGFTVADGMSQQEKDALKGLMEQPIDIKKIDIE